MYSAISTICTTNSVFHTITLISGYNTIMSVINTISSIISGFNTNYTTISDINITDINVRWAVFQDKVW